MAARLPDISTLRTEDAIGGHAGMDVHRTEGGILKVAHDQYNWDALFNEFLILNHLSDSNEFLDGRSRLAPEPLGMNEYDRWTLQTDHGPSRELRPDEGEAFRRAAIRWLDDCYKAGVRHGDVTGINIVIDDKNPQYGFTVIDWQESHYLTEPGPQKQPWSDRQLMMRSVYDLTGDTPRVARRWLAVLKALGIDWHEPGIPRPLTGQRFIDYGCYEGDFVALATLEGMNAYGVDRGGFRTGEDSLATALQLWRGMSNPPRFVRSDVVKLAPLCEVAMCFSTWPYVLNDHGDEAERWLERVVRNSKVLFFESQYEGDGPGCGDASDIESMFNEMGAEAQIIETIPVTGRDAERDVWKVVK